MSNVKVHTHTLLKLFFENNSLVQHLLDSFNDASLRKLDDIIEGFNPIEINHTFVPEDNEYKYKILINIRNPILSKPMIVEKDGSSKIMTPFDARNRNFTYASPLYVDVHVTASVYNAETRSWMVDQKKMPNVLIGKFPIMVRSKYCVLNDPNVRTTHEECRYDEGGYFIVNGNEKIVVSQDRIAENKTYVFVNNKDTQYSHVAEIRSVQENKFSVPKTTTLKFSSKPTQFGHYIRVSMHHVKQDLPVVVLFRALGVITDKDIARLVFYDENHPLVDELTGSLEEGNHIVCQRDAIDFISRHMSGLPNVQGMSEPLLKSLQVEAVKTVLSNEFLPHVGPSYEKKALYLGSMVKRVILCYKKMIPYDDRDSYVNKRIDTPGILLANLFRQYFGKVIKDMKNMISKEIQNGSWKATNSFINVINKVNMNKIIKSTIIESGLKYGLATGNWGVKSNKSKQGVAQVLNRMTFNATISHNRRINTPVDKTAKILQPRKLHASLYGVICPAETPEGVSVGLVKNMSILSGVTISSNSSSIRACLEKEGVTLYKTYRDYLMFANPEAVKVIVNGDILGVHDRPAVFYENMKRMKQSGVINVTTSVSWNVRGGEINICTEGGRCVRPLVIVDKNKSRIEDDDRMREARTWTDVVGELQIVEYLDVEESDHAMIAMTPADLQKGLKGFTYPAKYTHHEIHASMMFGVLASLIPFSDHNQAPRNCYQAAMGKQAIGLYTSNYRKRYDTLGHVLNYPQKAIVSTRAAKLMNNDALPCGNNVIVAIMTYTGYNQEDSVMLNQSAIERGLFGSTHYRTYKEQNNKNHSTGEEEFFCNPVDQNGIKLKPFNYKKLGADGFVPENTYVESGDVVIGKCMPHKSGLTISYKDTSVVVKNNESGFVDRICNHDHTQPSINGDGYMFTKMTLRSDRIPCIGDKFCVPADTEVLTSEGWVQINAVSPNDYVLQLDPATDVISFEKALSVSGFRCMEDDVITHVLGPSIDLVVTSEHKMWVSEDPKGTFGFKKAADLSGEEWYKKSGKFPQGDLESIESATELGMSGADFAYVYGVFKRRGVLNAFDQMPNVELPALSRLIILLNECEFSYLWPERGTMLYIYNPMLLECLKKFQKYVGVQTWVYEKALAQSFLDGFFDAEGAADTSVDDADALQLLALIAGDFSIDIAQGPGRWRKVTKVKNVTCEYEIKRFKAGHLGIHMVYCVEVPSHVFWARRNGKCAWTGNSSRHGQKGTVGMTYKQADLPFTAGGIVPDIIVNPHAIPSRMTIAQLMECVMGKACVAHGCYGDASPFTDCSVSDIADAMTQAGLERHGDEIMYNPRTGEQMPTAIFVGPTFYQRLKHMVTDKIHCLTEDHDVLTERGWIKIPEVRLEDKVATLTQYGELVYEHPTGVLHFPEYEGQMYHIKNTYIDLNVTANHRMLVSAEEGHGKWQPFQLQVASDIAGKRVRYKRDAQWVCEDYQFVLPGVETKFNLNNKDKILDMDAWLAYFGIWMAEGWTTGKNKIQICQCKPRVREAVFEVIKTLGYNCHAYADKITITNKQLFDYLSVLSVGAPQKRLPDWVWSLSERQSRILVHHMILGDGTWRNQSVSYYTSSQGLADDFSRLCLHAGWSATKYVHIPKGQETYIKGRKIVNAHDVLRLSVAIDDAHSQPTVNHEHVHTQEEEIYHYSGPVYCLSVPSEIFYVRRNGKPVWTGNSRSQNGPVVLLTRQPAEGRARDGGLRLGEMEVECNWAHGISSFLKERVMECSDNYRVHVCCKCGMMANVNPESKIYQCKPCNNTSMFQELRIPYACKLLFQEIQTMSIGTRFIT